MKKSVKILKINGTRFALPESMPAKDVQSLAGFLCTLTEVGSEYDYDTGESIYYECTEGVSVQVMDTDLMTKADAKALAKMSRDNYHTREAKRKETAAES
jgi:hypothetical protein